MLYTVRKFCSYVQEDINGLIDEVAGITRYVSDEEKKAYAGSYPVVADMLVQAMKKQPAIGDAHISTTELLLEYKLLQHRLGATWYCWVPTRRTEKR